MHFGGGFGGEAAGLLGGLEFFFDDGFAVGNLRAVAGVAKTAFAKASEGVGDASVVVLIASEGVAD